MKKIDLYLSTEAPRASKGSAWLKPVTGGFALYILNNGWEPLKIVDGKGTASEGDDTVESTATVKTELIGKDTDAGTANTINGAKNYATTIGNAIIGTEGVTDTPMPTLWGLKAYIDEQIASLSTEEGA